MDLSDKPKWHTDFNKGFIPVLEVPSGEMFPESDINAQYALQVAGAEQGIQLIPSDPVAAAKVRTAMAKFESEMLGPLFGIYLKKFKPEGAEDFLARAVPLFEQFCA